MFENVINWSKSNYLLPWRTKRTLYKTLVSEMMLQQTTVSTVINHFERFLKVFPDISSLAAASEEKLLQEWKGLGYYRRAKNLRKIALVIEEKYSGKIPSTYEELIQIDGIGPYTASALLGIGMDKEYLAIDANLERVLARLFQIDEIKGPKLQKKITDLFKTKEIIKERNLSFRSLNEALMDVGRNLCQAKRVSCAICPLNQSCLSYKNHHPLEYPKILVTKAKDSHELELLRVIVKSGEKILCYQKNSNEWLSGQWEVPTFIIKSSDKKIEQYPYIKKTFKDLPSFTTAITKYKIKNHVLVLNQRSWKEFDFERECSWKEVDTYRSNLSTSSDKALKKVKIL